jgi:transcription elongation factor Elf1
MSQPQSDYQLQSPPVRGTTLPCPYCGEAEAAIDLHLAEGTFTCTECSTDFTAEEVRSLLARWQGVLNWVYQMPGNP